MPAWVANLLKVEVQAPIYGLVLAVPSSITRFPSAEAFASPPSNRLANSTVSRAATTRIGFLPSKISMQNGIGIQFCMPEGFLGCIAEMRFREPARRCGQALILMPAAKQLDAERHPIDHKQRQIDGGRTEDRRRLVEDRAAL